MSPVFDVLFPALMVVAPAAFTGLWCLWTGVGGLRPLLLATLGTLLAFGAFGLLLGPAWLARPWVRQAWALVPLLALLWGFGVPLLRRATRSLPAPPKAASLRPRTLALFPGAFLWPFAAWAALLAALLLRGATSPWAFLGPALGLAGLVALRPLLRLGLLEPEPLGGPDPGALAEAYARFRLRRTRLMYALMVALALGVSSPGVTFGDAAGGAAGAAAGAAFGALGALLGTWCDAQRYLLRLQLSGAPPPGA